MSGKSLLVHVHHMYAPHSLFSGRLKGWMSVMVPPAASLLQFRRQLSAHNLVMKAVAPWHGRTSPNKV